MQDILKDKVAVVYGAGPIGSTVAKSFAESGAKVFVGDYKLEAAKKLASEIAQNGNMAEAIKVDALDKDSVEAFLKQVTDKAGKVDVSFNAINITSGGEQGQPLTGISYEDFALPITTYTKTQFLTATAAARYMQKQKSGVIMMITAIPAHMPAPYTTGFGPAWAAMEATARTLAAELGQDGIRTVVLHSTGSPETADSISRTFTKDEQALKIFDEKWNKLATQHRLLPNPTSLKNVGTMAAFMASDYANATTGTVANMTAGMVV